MKDRDENLIEDVPLAWSSSAPAIIEIDGSGALGGDGPVYGRSLKNGAATVTASAGTASDSVTVIVEQVAASVRPAAASLSQVGETMRLPVVVRDAREQLLIGADRTAVWRIEDATVATVNASGLLTATGLGVTSVHATVGETTGSARVEVAAFETDRDILTHFFEWTGGAEWDRNSEWGTDAPLSEWWGVETDEDERVTAIDLARNNLTGDLPGALGLLTELRRLDLDTNDLSGMLPPQLGRLQRLESFDAAGNDLQGPIPPEWGGMAALQEVDLGPTPSVSHGRPNRLSGALPAELGNLGNLQSLDLSHNQLAGPIPGRWRNLGSLRWLDLFNNGISGQLPIWLGELPALRSVQLGYNSLSGEIPPEIGNAPALRDLGLDENELTGPVPPEVGRLQHLTSLGLCGNPLSGSVPDELGDLGSLRWLRLCDTDITGPIPAQLGALANLETLDLGGSGLSGAVPPALGKLARLTRLDLCDNPLTGPLPVELGQLSSLRELAICATAISGPIPPELGNLQQLTELTLTDNPGLGGVIPPELANLTRLETLSLARNQLSGPIPPELANLKHLETLNLTSNRLSGEIPPELGRLPALIRLSLGQNRLSGGIPAELGRLAKLESFHAALNRLAGPLPPELGRLSELMTLELDGNVRLIGVIPESFLGLTELYTLSLGSTGLCVPSSEEFLNWRPNRPYNNLGRDCSPADAEALTLDRIFDGLGGDAWVETDGWEPGRPAAGRRGVTVDERGRVTGIDLSANGLRGRLPPDLDHLTQIETLDLSSNDLEGDLPTAYAGLPGLRALRVGGNPRLRGPVARAFLDSSLRTLDVAGTALCVSPAPSVRAWWRQLEEAAGSPCENPDEILLSFPAAYLVQSVQGPAGHVRTIAGRDALLRAFVTGSPAPAFFEFPVVATFWRSGAEVYRTELRRETDVLATGVVEGDLAASYNGVIPGHILQPGVGLVLQADPEGALPLAEESQTRHPASGVLVLDVVKVPPMRVTVVPILEAARDSSFGWREPTGPAWAAGIDAESPQAGLLRHAFPTGELSIRARESYFTSLGRRRRSEILDEMMLVREAEDGSGHYFGAGTHLAGYFTGAGHVGGYAELGGWVAAGEARDREFAHELGHNLGLLEGPCGNDDNPWPSLVSEDAGIGFWGYDFRTGTLVDPASSRHLMQTCLEAHWMNDYLFEKMIDHLKRAEHGSPQHVRGPPERGEGDRRPHLVLWGGHSRNWPHDALGLRLQPALSMMARTRRPRESGPYRLEGVRHDGGTAFAFDFTPGVSADGDRHFFYTLPLDPAWETTLSEIRLTGPSYAMGQLTEVRRQGLDDGPSITVVRDRESGRIRALLRDWQRPLPPELGDPERLEVSTTPNLRAALRGVGR